ncbi:MAG: PadR family transcriptional regulator [Acidobacteriota bacterium]
MKDSMSLIRGTLDVLILNALSGGSLHGYGVVDWLREVTDGALEIDDGALYTALHRLEKKGWLEAEWRVSPRGRRAKYYSVTNDGRAHRVTSERNWTSYVETVAKVFAARRAQEA